ncbi:hypothetical protein DUI87_20278 [Hirundo rustica rustica]|uniref:Uncharacterized protein n=1 Tax=Hirundo rustica rustica TaxID=333673 RepID=A0A3M0JQT9_HIRRU|nr:hypothetical protein DUI87_20278 [Hirundo rustica rustica]
MAEGGQPPQQQQPQPQLLAGGGVGSARGVKREPELEQPMPGGDGAEGGHSKRLRTEAEADGGGMQVELEIFVGARSSDGKDWMKQSSPVLTMPSTGPCSVPCQGSAKLCLANSPAGKLC